MFKKQPKISPEQRAIQKEQAAFMESQIGIRKICDKAVEEMIEQGFAVSSIEVADNQLRNAIMQKLGASKEYKDLLKSQDDFKKIIAKDLTYDGTSDKK